MDKFVGKRLDGRYEIHELIGTGGMAYVYRAYDRVDDRWVAIKILKEEFSDNSDFLRRFRNESKAIAVLSHPNIVKVFDVSFGDQIQYIVMEYIDGITLKEYIEQEGVIRWNEALHFTTQILMGLEHAHAKGIIHRDVKPQNIMLLQDGSIKVADFGIARFLQSETQTMTDKAIGSVHYIAPEQAKGDYITDKADIYSVGVMLYEMITGKLPFEADNAVSVALMQLQAKPVYPREINPSIPRGLEQITMKAMEKNPIDRFQSAGEMLDDIDALRRNPSMAFHYEAQAGAANYDVRRSMEAYDTSRYTPEYDDNYEYEEEFVRSRKRAKVFLAIKGFLAAAVVITIAVLAVYFIQNWNATEPVNDQIVVPNFSGLNYVSEIAGNEEYKDFTFVTKEGNDPQKDPGVVLSQNPQQGITVKKGQEIELTINGRVEQVSVPVLEQQEQAAAIQLLSEMGLKYKIETISSDDVDIGKIVKSDPQAGTEVDMGSQVTLFVSSGPATKKVKVPDNLVGDLKYNVTAKIQDAGLTVGNITTDDSSTEAADIVISVNPGSGSEVSAGSTVDIVVSSGKGSSKTLSYSLELPSGVNVDITLEVYRSGTLVETSTVNPALSGTYTVSFTGTSGSETVVIQLNDQNYAYLEFNYDAQTTRMTDSFDFVPSGGGGGDDDSSSSSSSEVSSSGSEIME